MIPALLVLFLACAAISLVGGVRLHRRVIVVAALPLAASLVGLLSQLGSVLDGATPRRSVVWVERLGLGFAVRLDGLATLMALLVTVIGLLVLLYSWSYFAHEPSRELVARFAGCFTLFSGSMLGLVLADDVWTMFTCWELTSVFSFFLIGLHDDRPDVRTAAQRALLVTGAGGLALLGGLVCLVHEAGGADLRSILAGAPSTPTAQVGVALVLVGAFAKSAQFPLHFWLPGAMAAPTPVSAFLHSATMVKAGVLVVARFAPAFSGLAWWTPTMVIGGGATMLVGGVAALRRDDAKRSLAFGTVSQLGLLVVLFGIGDDAATAAGIALLLAHALFKSALFLVVGAVEHATGSRNLTELSGVGRRLPSLATAAGLCTLSMVGLPPLLGFAAKESALGALLDADGAWSVAALAVVLVGSVLTTAYSVRVWFGLFGDGQGPVRATVRHAPGRALVAPVVLLAAASSAAGIGAAWVGSRLTVAATAVSSSARVHLAAWPGLHLPLVLSGCVVIAGVGVWHVARRLPPRSVAIGTFGERSYGRAYAGVLDGARRVTSVTQSGSLPVYLAVVFSVVIAAVGVAVVRGAGSAGGSAVLADSWLQAAVAVMSTVMSVAVAAARRRFVAVLLLGGVGQTLTVLFLMYGAPDLALTQFMIETLGIVAFLLVLRHFPAQFTSPPTWAPRVLRIGLAGGVGAAMAWFAFVAGSRGHPTDVRDAMEEMSLAEAGGRNVVNVAIVDFRGMDTMFEIAVFGIAALGVANLVLASRRNVGFRPSALLARMGAGSMIFEQVTRMIFHVTLLVSLYVTLRGHNAPGGGFAGGLIAGAAFVFRLLAGGSDQRSYTTRVAPTHLIATGLVLAVGTGLAPLALGREFLDHSVDHAELPVIGGFEVVSAAVFDLGVYLLVIGVVVVVLTHLAARTHTGGSAQGSVA